MREWIGRRAQGLTASLFAALVSGCGGGGASAAASGPIAQSYEAVCPEVPAGRAHCSALVRTDLGMSTNEFRRTPQSLRIIETLPRALGPIDLQAAYNYPVSGGNGATIAIINAYDHPTAESDLAVYREFYHLPACTTANGCFTRVAQDGTQALPVHNSLWSAEAALDTQVASAVCPQCKILLVEAKTDNLADLANAVDRAVTLGATVVSNSYGSLEWDGEADLQGHFNHPGVVMTAAAGDVRDRVEFPAASSYVVAVGGTDLTRSSAARGFAESVWSGSAGGCSAYIAKPAWQHDAGCPRRTVADVSFVATPDMPVAIYHSDCGGSVCGWTAYSGTSVGAPAIAAMYALAGNSALQRGAANLYAAPASAFNDIVSGGSGACGNYLCTGVVGYDAPSGLGSPNGLAAF